MGAALAAEPERLARFVDERVASVLAAARAVMAEALAEAISPPNFPTTDDVVRYMRDQIGHRRVEELHALYMTRDASLLAHELVARGSRNEAVFDPREVVRRALDLGAAGVLIAHNHPSRTSVASRQDVLATTDLVQAAAVFDIRVIDHFIITQQGWSSMRAEGLM